MEKNKKRTIIKDYGRKEGDSGSTEVQVALLTEEINRLSEHLKANVHDHSCRRGLMRAIGQRRRLLTYLAKEDAGRYAALVARLGLRK